MRASGCLLEVFPQAAIQMSCIANQADCSDPSTKSRKPDKPAQCRIYLSVLLSVKNDTAPRELQAR